MKKKLLVLQTHVIQYFSPLYRSIAERENVELVVAYLYDKGLKEYFDPGFGRTLAWDIDLLSGYQSAFMSGSNFGGLGKALNACRCLRRERPDWVLLYGYNRLENWIVLLCAKASGVKVAYAADSNVRESSTRVRKLVKKVPVRIFFAFVDTILFAAEANRDYALKYGASPHQLTWCPLAIDTKRFEGSEKSSRFGPRYDFVWAGELDKRKRVGDFIEALLMLRRDGLAFKAVIAGAGEDDFSIRTKGEALTREGRLDYVGFLNQSAIPALLGNSDVFVFTSEYDAYGLTVTEAAASACALVVTGRSGCVGEMGSARPGLNAFVYEAGDIHTLYECMRKLLTDRTLKNKMRDESRRISKFSDVACAAQIIENVVAASA